MNNEELRALCIPAEERQYTPQVDRVVERICNSVIQAAKEGKTEITGFPVMMSDFPCEMIIRQVHKRFTQARVGYERQGEVRHFFVEWKD
jgi:hypothetical protein